VFGPGYVAGHPQLVAAVMASAASDWAALIHRRRLREVATDPVKKGAAGLTPSFQPSLR
jgi:hypothetical protein